MTELTTLDQIFNLLPKIVDRHTPCGELHILLKKVARNEVLERYNQNSEGLTLPRFGKIFLPFFKMGAIDSTHLFDLDELILFQFYWANKNNYKKAADIGANLGLHTIMLEKCGVAVDAYEPDPTHFKELKENLVLNNLEKANAYNVAVSTAKGSLEFVRVLGNTTASHLKGARTNVYGDLEYYNVESVAFKDLIKGLDFIKMDVEGHEAEILISTSSDDWGALDAIIEIQDEKNAYIVFEHLKSCGVNIFSQKINWEKIQSPQEMPFGYKEGMVFVSKKNKMPWSESSHA